MVVVFALVLALCLGTWYAIAKTIGLRVSPEAELAGLDISEHGMYGYPEQFIPDAELYGVAVAPIQRNGGRAPAPAGSRGGRAGLIRRSPGPRWAPPRRAAPTLRGARGASSCARHVPWLAAAGRALRPRRTGGGRGGDAARALRARRRCTTAGSRTR